MYRDTLNCEAVQRCLWPLDEPRPYSEEEEAARMHLGHCTGCREFFERDAALGRAIARYGLGARAPRSLHQRIREALFGRGDLARPPAPSVSPPPGDENRAAHVAGEIMRATRFPVRLRREGWAVAAAVVAFLAAATFFGGGASGVGEVYAEDYLSHVEDLKIYSPDPTAVSAFFQQQMGVGLRPVILDGGQVTRAMVCVLADRQAAMVEYALGEHIVAHYRIIRDGQTASPSRDLRFTAQRGVTTVTWQDATFEHALVSDLPTDDLLVLARAAFSAR